MNNPITITWNSVEDELPDDEMTVLIALDDGEVWTGFLDGDQWRYVSADLVEARVTHWAHFPPPPSTSSHHRATKRTRDRSTNNQ